MMVITGYLIHLMIVSAAAKATQDVWNVVPDFTREGGSIQLL